MVQKVLIVGGTGLTGKEIVKSLVKDKDIELTCLTRPGKPPSPFLTHLRIPLLPLDLSTAPLSTLTEALTPFPTVISCIGFSSHATELRLIDALAPLPLTRFIPCSWATPCPSGDIMLLRDEKQRVFERVWQHRIPYTIVDVGYWYQISLPRVESGKLDGLIVLDAGERFGDGTTENLLIDKRDIGAFVAEIVKDERTVGKWVVCWGERIDQEGGFKVVREESGEVVGVRDVSHEALTKRREEARAAYKADPEDMMKRVVLSTADYQFSKHVRGDNSLENAKYLGYLDARELYPDIKPKSFREFVREALDGKGEKLELGDMAEYVKNKDK